MLPLISQCWGVVKLKILVSPSLKQKKFRINFRCGWGGGQFSVCLCVTLPNTASCKLTVNGFQKNVNRLGQNYKSCNTVLGRYISAAFFRGPSPNKTPPSPSHLTRGSVIFHFRFSRTDVSRNVITMKFIFQKTCRNS